MLFVFLFDNLLIFVNYMYDIWCVINETLLLLFFFLIFRNKIVAC